MVFTFWASVASTLRVHVPQATENIAYMTATNPAFIMGGLVKNLKKTGTVKMSKGLLEGRR